MPPTDPNPSAGGRAEQGSDAWADAVRLQRWATPANREFYALAGEMVSTLYTLEDLTRLLVKQVGDYGTGRTLYDDTRSVDPAARMQDAVSQLREASADLSTAAAAVNRFWSAIGHIGVETTT